MSKVSGQYNPDKWDFNPGQSGSEDGDEQPMPGGRTPGSRNIHSLLRQEALADFKALDGYWSKIIVRDMASPGDDFLPDMLIV